MRDEHIIGILESAPLGQLGESVLTTVRAHVVRCAECRRAYEAAQVSSLLLKERAAETIEPSPFFQTRVLAALRERQAAHEAPALSRLWRAAGALVSSMALAVVLLVGLTFIPGLRPAPETQQVAAFDPYSAEAVFLAQDNLTDAEINNYGQVLAAIYGSGEDAEGVDGQDK